MSRKFIPLILIIAAVVVAVYALRNYSVLKKFANPIAYTMVDDTIYIVEKENNTILELEYISPAQPLVEKGRYGIEEDDEDYYYMVRKLYPGPNGVVVQSQVYDRKTKASVGHRLREYRSFSEVPKEILIVYFKDPLAYPWIRYACDEEGSHYVVNECVGQYYIWKIPEEGNVTVMKGNVPPAVEELGKKNEKLAYWGEIHVDASGNIFALDGQTDRILHHSPAGERIREIGTAGFEEGGLLAPAQVFPVSFVEGEPALLTVTSTGNRTWVQFDEEGKVVRIVSPLKEGYKYSDILVGRIYPHQAGKRNISFDLVNKNLIVHDGGFSTISEYETPQIIKTGILCGLAVVLLLLAVFYGRLVDFFTKIRFPFFLKLLILFVPLFIIAALVVGDQVKGIMKADLEAESVRRSCNLAHAIVNSIELSDLEAIQDPEDRKSEAYKRIYNTVSKLVDTKHVCYTPKWIIHKIRDGRFYFGINIWRGPIYEPFIVPQERQMFFNVLKEKKSQYGRFTDEQGEWFSFLCPILDAAGNVINVVELYRPTEEMDRVDREVVLRIARTIGIIILFVVPLIFLFSYMFTRPLYKLMRESKIISKGNFDRQIKIHSRDEVGDLAQAFNQMRVDLKKYIHDLARTTAEKERMQSELRLAHEMQQGILPRDFPPFPGAENVEGFARLEPAQEVGGDYYDFFMIDEHHLGVVVADVCGHGVPAGLFMMITRALLRNNARDNLSAAGAIKKMNTLLVPDNPSNLFVTMFYLVCDIRTGQVTFCNAGHHPPVWVRGKKAENFIEEKGKGEGTIVGMFDNAAYTDAEMVLFPGESLILYTDGIIECPNKNNELYGKERLVRLIEDNACLSNKEICGKVFADLSLYEQGTGHADDITILFFKFLG